MRPVKWHATHKWPARKKGRGAERACTQCTRGVLYSSRAALLHLRAAEDTWRKRRRRNKKLTVDALAYIVSHRTRSLGTCDRGVPLRTIASVHAPYSTRSCDFEELAYRKRTISRGTVKILPSDTVISFPVSTSLLRSSMDSGHRVRGHTLVAHTRPLNTLSRKIFIPRSSSGRARSLDSPRTCNW